MDWLNQATSTLDDVKKDTLGWEEKKRRAEETMTALDRNRSDSRDNSLSLVETSENEDDDTESKHIHQKNPTQGPPLHPNKKKHKGKEKRHSRQQQLQQKQQQQQQQQQTPENSSLAPLPPPSFASASSLQKKAKKPPPPSFSSPRPSISSFSSSSSSSTISKSTPDPSINYKEEFPNHKSQTTLDGSFHSVEVWHLNDQIFFEATDPVKKETLNTKSRLKMSFVSKKTAIERDKFYETLIKRLAFRQIELPKAKSNVPRYMQQTGKAGKKFLVLLKVNDPSTATTNSNAPNKKSADDKNRLPPFFRDKVAIDDIILDISAFTTTTADTTTITFYDPIYDASTNFQIPTFALPSFNANDIKEHLSAASHNHNEAPPTSLTSNNFNKNAPLSSSLDVRTVFIKQIINVCHLSRIDDEDSPGNTSLQIHTPNFVKEIIRTAAIKQSHAVKVQSIARRNFAIAGTKIAFERLISRRASAKYIQKILRGRLIFWRFKKPLVHYSSAKTIQTKIRKILALRVLKAKKLQFSAAVVMQSALRSSTARSALTYKIMQLRASTKLQNFARAIIAKKKLKMLQIIFLEKSQIGAATRLQQTMRATLAKRVVHQTRIKQHSTLCLQRAFRVVIAKRTLAALFENRKFNSSTITLQKLARKKRAVRCVNKLIYKRNNLQNFSATILQRKFRSRRAKEIHNKSIFSATKIQSRIRICLAVRRTKLLVLHHSSAISIQRHVRANIAKKKTNLLRERCNNLQLHSAIVLQNRARIMASVKQLKGRQQRYNELTELKNNCCTKIQAICRSKIARKRTTNMKVHNSNLSTSAITVQTKYRFYVARRNYWKLVEAHNAAIYIQTQARIMFARKIYFELFNLKFEHLFNSAVLIQSCARRNTAKRFFDDLKERRRKITKMKLKMKAFASSVTIQKTIRSRLLNAKHLAKQKGAMAEKIRFARVRETCAILVQSKIREYNAKEFVKHLRLSNLCAVKIQCRLVSE